MTQPLATAPERTQLLANGTIRGMLFEDLDGNGSADLHERAVSAVLVQLYAGDTPLQQFTTTANGGYQFDGVPSGVYRIVATADQFVQSAAVTATLTAERPGANLDVSLGRCGRIGASVAAARSIARRRSAR